MEKTLKFLRNYWFEILVVGFFLYGGWHGMKIDLEVGDVAWLKYEVYPLKRFF